ncbi:MAG: hypothetical protein IIC78_10520 [Chloroflexi bacterium]|nr:hypothetical protein [Chloroflexota bacterium]
MADIRCPMCSKPNAEEAQVCEFCGARITPLIIGQDAEEPRGDSSDASRPIEPISPSPTGSDWLSRMRNETPADEEVGAEELPADPARGSTDLLGRLEGLGLSETADDSAALDFTTDKSPHELKAALDEAPASEIFEDPSEELLEAAQETFAEPMLASAPDPSEAQDETTAEGVEEEYQGTEDRVPDWLARIRDRRKNDEDHPQEDLTDERLVGEAPESVESHEQVVESREQAVESDEEQISASDIDQPEGGVTKDGLAWSFIKEDDLDSIDLHPEKDEDSSTVGADDLLENSFDSGEQISVEAKQLDDLKVGPFDPGTADDLLAELESSSDIEQLPHEREEPFTSEDPVLTDDLTSLEALFEEFGPQQDVEDLLGKSVDPPAAQEEVDVSPALENLIADLDRYPPADTPAPEAEEPSIADDEVSIEGLYEAFGPGGDKDDLFPETEQPSDLDAGGTELEDLFAEMQSTEEDDTSTSNKPDLFLERVGDEDGGSDLFADLDRHTDTEELFSTTQDLPAELRGDAGDDSAFEAMVSDEKELEGEAKPISLADDSLQLLQDSDKDKVDSLIDSDFLADLGVDVSEAEQPPDGRTMEQTLEQPPAEDLAINFDDTPDANPELEAQVDASQIDRIAGEEDQGEEPLSLPPFQLADIDPSQMDVELGGISPSWLDDESDKKIEEGAEQVPALVMSEDDTTGEEFGQQLLAAEASMDEMPAWLQDLGADIGEEEMEGEEQDEPVLARAKLPSWLEAMRPIETFRVPPELELEQEEVEEIVEAAGPLAGLRGVLLAEPVVAMPRSASTGVAALDISELHYSHTEILRQMISEEELELARPEKAVAPYPVVRWICGALLVLAVALPKMLGFPTFDEPLLAPRSLNSFLEVVNSTPAEKPALMIFDYEPGYSGEMDAVAGALVKNLFDRNQTIVTLSTRLSGPLLADRLLLRTGSINAIENGTDYLHLGYLSGGASAIQLFADSPRRSLVSGFRLPEGLETGQPWSAEILRKVNQVSDFSLIAVLTSGTENARMWVEQLHTRLDNTPLVFVTTAGAEPIMRPYYESENPQIDGILTGLQSGRKYEVWNDQFSDASRLWNSFGMGILVAELFLLAGLIYGSARWLVQQGIGIRD